MNQSIQAILEKTQNPLTHKSIVEDRLLVQVIEQENKHTIELKAAGDRKWQLAIEAQLRTSAVKEELAPDSIKIKWIQSASEVTQQAATARPARGVPGVQTIIAIASGKGGVGKSTVSANLAVTLANMKYKVGIIDADIYGPSIGKMFGFSGRQDVVVKDDKITPLEKFGIKIMSFAFLIDEKQPVVWRGPMLGKAVEQFLYDIQWGSLDFLIVDLPPGTGDTQLSLAQLVELDGVVIVTTPQSIALLDAGRAVSMFEQVNIPVLGVVENMSEYICPHCGKGSHIFSKGGGAQLAAGSDSVLLGQIPLVEEFMQSAEKGEVALFKPKSKKLEPIVAAFEHIVQNLLSLLEQGKK